MSYKMKGTCFYGKSPLKDIDTTFVDRIYQESKTDEVLRKKGYHTGKKHDGTYDKKLRGKKNTEPSYGKEVGGNNRMLGSGDLI